MNNEEWKHSNGAWIRTEVWACLYPGQPDKAIAYAFEDACVDHGYGEGSYAAIFVAAMESAAFVINDLQALIEIGLSKIPEDCRVAKSVRLVMEDYANKVDWKTARNNLVKDSEDLGWFQAPANVAFVVLGLLYGEGDFKKSMILAINCGDDTDCTGATLGSLMGIMNGEAGLPTDWLTHIGEEIVTMCVLKGHGRFPANCVELTDCVMNLLPVTCRTPLGYYLTHGLAVEITSGENDLTGVSKASFMGDAFVRGLKSRSRFSFRVNNPYAEIWVEFDREPYIAPGETLTGKVSAAIKTMPEQKHFHLRWLLPRGWSAEGRLNLHANAEHSKYKEYSSAAFTLYASDDADVSATNRLVLEVTCPGRAMPVLVPIVVLG
jgi:hypothetical protein